MMANVKLFKTIILAAAFSVILTPLTGLAQGGANLGPFTDFDSNQDGSVSKDEWNAAFKTLDANKDNAISEDEVPPPPDRPN